MKIWDSFFKGSTVRWIDHIHKTHFLNEPYTALHSFALDDALSLSVSEEISSPVLRLWTHEKTVVLGIPDARMPFIQEGIRFLNNQGYDAIVRNSGGLAVPLDQGVLNLSFILPETASLSIHDGYEAMFHFIQFIFRDLTKDIAAYEIVGSYCPGDYDLSIKGKKFSGISQRRVRKGVAIQIYIDLYGDSLEKGNLMQEFYETSLQHVKTSFQYPTIKPETVSSLSTLLDQPITPKDVKKRILQAISHFDKKIISTPLTLREKKHYKNRLQQMVKRNEEIS